MTGAANKTVVVTGVSSGIGHATARVLVKKGFKVFGSVRTKADADRLSSELGGGFEALLFDVTKVEEINSEAERVRHLLRGHTLGGLVNNAGVGLGGPIELMPMDNFRQTIEVNLFGVLNCLRAFLPLLGTDETLVGPPGRVVNIGSVGGRMAYPFMSPYHVSKFGLEGLTDSLRRELLIFGIDAILIAPASIDTPIWEKAENSGVADYSGTAYGQVILNFLREMVKVGRAGISPERVGETIHEALTTSRPKVRYVVTGRPLEQFMTGILPKRWMDRIVAKRIGVKRR